MSDRKCKSVGCYNSAVTHDGFCARHTKLKRKKGAYSRRTYPKSAEPHLGIEIECFAPDDLVHTAMLAQFTVPCRDGSLHPEMGCEFKLCRPAKKIVSLASLLVGNLAAAGARVNRTCGLHVHLDAREVSAARRQEFIEWLRGCQEWFYSLVPPSRRSNGYCRRISEGRSHYEWANKTDYNTIEIRLHPSTLNRHKMTGWLTAMRDLMALLRSNRSLPTFVGCGTNAHGCPIADESWVRSVFPSAEAFEYVMSRANSNGRLDTYANRSDSDD